MTATKDQHKSTSRVRKPGRKTSGTGLPNRFEKGNTIGKDTRFKQGDPGGPGRPPNANSPRYQLRRLAGLKPPQRVLDELARQLPDYAERIAEMTWAEAVAFRHLMDALNGEQQALKNVYLQIDGPVVDEAEPDCSSSPLEIVIVDKRTVTPEMLDVDCDSANEKKATKAVLRDSSRATHPTV